MREMRRVDESQRSSRTAVVRVTVPARTTHSALDQGTVQGRWIGLLGSNIGMAIYAQASHVRRAPEGRMAGGAARANLCVRCNAPERLARFGTERPRAEKNVALEY
jgi:hypothetical protein